MPMRTSNRFAGRRRGAWAGLLAAAILVLAPGASRGEPRESAVINEFSFYSPSSGPSIVMPDRGGGVWIALAKAGKLAHVVGSGLREYHLPPDSFPVGLAVDRDGDVWYSDIRRNKIGRLDPRTGSVRDYAVPTPDSWPFFIVTHPDGHLWFTQRMGNNIGRLDPVTGEVTEYPVPTPHCQPAGMTVTPDGEVFFTENSGNRLGRFDHETGRVVEYEVPTKMTPSPFYGLAGIASDRDGNLWFAEVDGRLGFLERGADRIREIPVPNPASRPAGVAVDDWGLVWFTELDGNAISLYDPEHGEFRTFQVPTGRPDPRPMGPPEATARGQLPAAGFAARTSRPFGIAVDRSGRVWFSQQYAHKGGVLTPPEAMIYGPAGTVREARMPLRLRLRTRRSGPRIEGRIDGQPIRVEESLDVARLGPGEHVLEVEVGGGDAPPYLARSTFTVEPSLEMVELLVDEASGEELRRDRADRLLEALRRGRERIRQGDTPAGREVTRHLIGEIEAADGIAEGFSALLLAHLRYLDLFAERRYDVRVGADGTLDPPRTVIEVGDRVRFFRPDGDGSGELVLVARNGDLRSPPLAGGDEWASAFGRRGEYALSVSGRTGVVGTIVVGRRTTRVRDFAMAAPDRIPNVLAVDEADNIWFTLGGGGYSKLATVPVNQRVGRLSPDGRLTEFETPSSESGPTSIDVGPDGRVWFTLRAVDAIASLDPESGEVREHALPTRLAGATGIAADHHRGWVWVAQKLASSIAGFDPSSGEFVEFETPTPESQPSTVMVDDDGNVWFDERANDAIVRLDPESGEMQEYRVPTPGSRVVGLVPDGEGGIWFLQLAGNKVGHLDVATGAVTEYSIPTPHSAPFKLAVDGVGRVWFTQVFGNQVAVLDDGRFYEFAVPTSEAMLGGIAIDSRGNVWFSQQAANRLGVLPGAAAVAKYEVGPPPPLDLDGINEWALR